MRYLLARHPCMRLVPHTPRIGGPGLMAPHDPASYCQLSPSYSQLLESRATAAAGGGGADCSSAPTGGAPSGAWLSAEEAALVQRFDPAGVEDTIGFFVAKFVKEAP